MFSTRPQARSASTQSFIWPAPVRGWVANAGLLDAPADAAERLDNVFPTASGARLRGGRELYLTIGAPPIRVIDYNEATPAITTETEIIYEYTSASDYAANVYLTGGDWSSQIFATAGGSFTVMVNGIDPAKIAVDSTFIPLTSTDVYSVTGDAQVGDFQLGETLAGAIHDGVIVGAKRLGTAADGIRIYLSALSGAYVVGETLTGSVTGSTIEVTETDATAISTINLTGVDTTTLSQVWSFKQRLFFVEKDTLSAWYLPVDSIGGAASELTFGSIFNRGGSLLFGATWSADSGDGLDDRCVFVTDEGEMAVYQGTNPASASTWSLVGVYYIGRPVSKHGFFRSGGELYIITDDGIIPVSSAVAQDRGQVSLASLSYPIEDEWRAVIGARADGTEVNATHWPSRKILLIGTPGSYDGLPVAFVCNTRTGAWARYTNWDVQCAVVIGGELFFGSSDNNVYKAEVGGSDNGTSYGATWIPKFSTCGTQSQKTASLAGLTARAGAEFGYGLQVFADYNIGTVQTAPTLTAGLPPAVWGTAVWGSSAWASEGNTYGQQRWKAAGATGFTLTPAISFTVNQEAVPDVELVSVQLLYEAGNIL